MVGDGRDWFLVCLSPGDWSTCVGRAQPAWRTPDGTGRTGKPSGCPRADSGDVSGGTHWETQPGTLCTCMVSRLEKKVNETVCKVWPPNLAQTSVEV